MAVHPVHARVRRRVERWVYGDRSDPYAALRRLSDRLEDTADPEQVVRTVATTIAEALRVDEVEVLVDRAASAPPADDRAGQVSVPLTHHGQPLGGWWSTCHRVAASRSPTGTCSTSWPGTRAWWSTRSTSASTCGSRGSGW